MRCKSCNVKLSDFESTRKYEDGEYVDMCNRCFRDSGYKKFVHERKDLKGRQEFLESDDVWEEF